MLGLVPEPRRPHLADAPRCRVVQAFPDDRETARLVRALRHEVAEAIAVVENAGRAQLVKVAEQGHDVLGPCRGCEFLDVRLSDREH